MKTMSIPKEKKIKKYNIPIFIPHEGCPHSCVFCNQKKITGIQTSVTFDDVRRIIEDYLGYLPKENRYAEVAFFGGSFTGLSLDMQEEFLKTANEYSDFIDGIRMSTRPDYINDDVLKLAAEYNVTAIELGLQSSDNEVLKVNERGHTFAQTIQAAEMIKKYKISLGLQMMVGMYGSNRKKDIKTAADTAVLRPDCVRIYPTLTLSGTTLEKLYKSGEYTPYVLDEAVDVTDEVMRIFEEKNINIIRVGLHSDESLTDGKSIVAGPYHPAFKELVLSKRAREVLEKEIVSDGCTDCTYTVRVPKSEVSVYVGHKRSNLLYFKDKYNVDLKVCGA